MTCNVLMGMLNPTHSVTQSVSAELTVNGYMLNPTHSLTHSLTYCCQVVFLTALFYLLATSSSSYKPADLFTSLSPATGKMAIGDAFEEAIG